MRLELVGAVLGAVLMAYGYHVTFTLTPQHFGSLLLGTAFLSSLILMAITAGEEEFRMKRRSFWAGMSLLSGYLLLLILFYLLIFEVRYPEHGFMVAFAAPVSMLCFVLSFRFKGNKLVTCIPLSRALRVVLYATALVYLYRSGEPGNYPPVWIAAIFGAVFAAWAVCVVVISRSNNLKISGGGKNGD